MQNSLKSQLQKVELKIFLKNISNVYYPESQRNRCKSRIFREKKWACKIIILRKKKLNACQNHQT